MSEPEATVSEAQTASRPGGAALRIGLVLALVVVLALVGQRLGGAVQDFARAVEDLGFWGPAVFVLGYAVATVAFVPGAVLTLAGGAIFGVIKGSLYVFTAAVLGSSAAFLLSRHGVGSVIERRLAGNTRFDAIQRAVAREGRRIVFLLRLSPVFPFNLLNYALGLTRVRFGDYLIASLGMIPGTILYVYYGAVAGEVAAVASGTGPERGAADYAVLGLGLAATVAVTAVVTRAARKALKEATGE